MAPAPTSTLGDSGLTRDEIYAAQSAQGFTDDEIAANIAQMFPEMGGVAPVNPAADLNQRIPENYYPDSAAALARPGPAYTGPGSSADNPFILQNVEPGSEEDFAQRRAAANLTQGMFVQQPDGSVGRMTGDAYTNENAANDQGMGGVTTRERNLGDQSRAFAMAAAEQIPFLDEAAVGAAGLISGRGYSDVRDSYQALQAIDNQTNRGQRIAGGLAGAGATMVAPGVGQAGNFIRAGAGGLNQTARAALVGAGAGGLFGAGAAEGGLQDRVEGGLLGAGVGAATGGLLDAGGQSLIASAQRRAAAGPSPARQLSRQGVDLTPGQAAGGVLRRVEDGLTSVPILGDAIRGAQRRGLGTFDNAATNAALEPIGVNLADTAGRQGVRAADDAIGAAYTRALDGTTVALDDTATAALANARRSERLTPEISRNLNSILDNALARFTDDAADELPKTYYHGSPNGNISSFDEVRGGGNFGEGLYVTRNADRAGEYAGQAGRVYPVRLRGRVLDLTTPEGRAIFEARPRGISTREALSADYDLIRAPGETVVLNPNAVRMADAPRAIPGDVWKQVDSELAAAIRAADRASANAPEQRILRDRLQEARDAVGGAFERADPMAFADVRAADRASAQYRLVRKASADAASAGRGGDASPATLNRAVVAAGGERQAARGESLLQDLTDNAMQVMPSTVPDSGTALRGLLSLGGIGGGATAVGANPVVVGGSIGALGLLSTAYGPTGQRIFNAIYRSTDRQAANSALGELARLASQNPGLQGQYEAAARHVLESFGNPSPAQAPEATGLLSPTSR
jgi:hypothetical protein